MQQFLGRMQSAQRSSASGDQGAELNAGASSAANKVDDSRSQPAPAPLNTDAELREALAQRDTALLRREGENFLLVAQVAQLKKQNTKACESALSLASQLSQVLQSM